MIERTIFVSGAQATSIDAPYHPRYSQFPMPNARMYLYCTILARTVPILFLASGILIGLRLLHDHVRLRHRTAGSLLMTLFTIVALAVTFSYIVRTSALIGAELAHDQQHHESAARRFQIAEKFGGRLSYRENFEMGESLLNAGAVVESVPPLERARHDPAGAFSLPAQHTLARAYFKLHQAGRAEALLRQLPERYAASAERDYMLARIIEGKNPRASAALFARSISFDADFFPSVYHLARLEIAAGNPAAARALLSRFFQLHPTFGSPEFRRALLRAVEAGQPLYDNEFL